MAQVSEVGRQALSDMRAMIGVLRTNESAADLAPQPDLAQLSLLIDRIRATGLAVELHTEGSVFPVGGAVELSIYRVIQEALTNTLKHAHASRASVTIRYGDSKVDVRVVDNGDAALQGPALGLGIGGMRERVALYHGTLRAGRVAEMGGGCLIPGYRAPDYSVTISVLLVDDQPLLRRGFRMILEAEEDMVVVGEAGDGDEAVGLAVRLGPDVVLMDIRMPNTDGIEATRRIIAEKPGTRVLALTTFDLDEYAFGALRAGVSGFLLKDVRPTELTAAIRVVASGDAVVSPRVTRRLLDEYALMSAAPGGARPDRCPEFGGTHRSGAGGPRRHGPWSLQR